MVEVVSRQRFRTLDQQHWEKFTQKALKAIDQEDASVRVAFISNSRIRQLNKQFRGIDRSTDVLSFPAMLDEFSSDESDLGDIAISVETADRQARENGLELDQEIAQLILHGLLHLCGYDHETDHGEMNKLELRLRRKLKI